ncbi:iron chelate uptake ABC transporter family permease subunit [Chelativorans alearense]|uniref:iron chelate uptake ABC transporter family permease subunit n=1 Tax=Chelativorans alearense TaxID=2681495 RepID=UPI001969D5C6
MPAEVLRVLRNQLAEPYLLGISAGASTGAVLVMVLGIGAGAVTLSGDPASGRLRLDFLPSWSLHQCSLSGAAAACVTGKFSSAGIICCPKVFFVMRAQGPHV